VAGVVVVGGVVVPAAAGVLAVPVLVVGLVAAVVVPGATGGMFGNAGVEQQPLESASAPLWGAWSKVIAISPPAL
jgi:hypothetical protein